MNEVDDNLLLSGYENVEEELRGFLKVVPWEDKNKQTWSPKLANILLEAGSLLDSFFRTIAPEKYTRSNGNIIDKEGLNINDFRDLFASKYNLASLRCLVYITPPILLAPFQAWQQAEQNLSWWTSYNKIKHDRIQNSSLATLETTLNATAGLFVAIAQYPPLFPMLLRHGWSNPGSYNVDVILPILSSEDRNNAVAKGILGQTFLAQTELLVTTLGPTKFPDEPSKINPIDYHSSGRLIVFLGKGYG